MVDEKAEHIKAYLDSLPASYAEVDKAFAALQTQEHPNMTFTETDTYKSAFWDIGDGNESRLMLVKDTHEVILYGFDHENTMNVFGTGIEQSAFVDLPTHLHDVLYNGDFFWTWDIEKTQEVFATAAFWLDEAGWHYSQQWADEANWDEEQKNSTRYLFNRFFKS